MSKYDIIIIGSGLGGLECGAILSKEGFNVCVVEKNAQFGGCFQTYQRKGHLLDTGIHYVGSLDEGQVMNQYFRYFGIMDKLKIKRLDDAAFDTIYYKGKTYDYAMGYPQFIETICRSFPHEKENLKCYAEQLQAVGNLISVDHLKQGTLALEGMKYFCTSAAHLIADITPDPALRNVLAGSALLYGGLKDVSTFYQHAMINHSYIEGAYRFVDGSMQVSLELINVIRANGLCSITVKSPASSLKTKRYKGLSSTGKSDWKATSSSPICIPNGHWRYWIKTVASRMPIFPASVRWKTPTAFLRSTW